jgi:hypothetical protein
VGHSIAVQQSNLLVERELLQDKVGALFRGELRIHPRSIGLLRSGIRGGVLGGGDSSYGDNSQGCED